MGRRGSLPRINVAPVPRTLVFRTMGRRDRIFKPAAFLLHVRPTVLYTRLYTTKIMQLLYSAPAYVRAHLIPHVTILNSHFWGGAKLRSLLITAKHVKKKQRQVNSVN